MFWSTGKGLSSISIYFLLKLSLALVYLSRKIENVFPVSTQLLETRYLFCLRVHKAMYNEGKLKVPFHRAFPMGNVMTAVMSEG